MKKSISFEDRLPEISVEISKRKNQWKLSTLDFDDVSQILTLRIFLKYHIFDENKGNFTHWVNRLITNSIKNILRDNLLIHSRPCIMGCTYNLGDNYCSYTKSGVQCSQCPLYKKWQLKKESRFNVSQSLPLENHMTEVNNKQCDFIDLENVKHLLDQKMKICLSGPEYKLYKQLYSENSGETNDKKIKEKYSYQFYSITTAKIIKLAKKIIEDEGIL